MINDNVNKKASLQALELIQLKPINRKKNRDYLDKMVHDSSLVTYYNCQKTSYFAQNCLEPKN